jgi:hypothetical protein
VAALRAAFVLTGDVRTVSTLAIGTEDDLREGPASTSPGKLFEQPVTRELLVFALSDAGLALCHSAGSR